jgi:hypothetical protein
MRLTKTNKAGLCRLLPLLALTILIVGVFFCVGATTAFAAEEPATNGQTSVKETLSVDEVWLTGDVLHIAVTDKNSGEKQTLELKLSDYAKSGDEYVSVQATDSSGRTSNSIQFKNPYYEPAQTGETTPNAETDGETTESGVPSAKPLTPDGAGSVVDNVTDADGKEFFTVETPDGNVFYLIVDRERDSENVYLLNAVNEDDLASLAKPGDGKSESAIPAGDGRPSVTAPPAVTTTPEITPEQTPEPVPEKSGNTGTIVFIVIAIIAVGVVGYYFKIVRPKKTVADDYDGGFDEPDDDAEFDLDGDGEEDKE